MADLLLTVKELEDLTGYARPKDQEDHLRRHGIPFVPKRGGGLSVARAWVEQWPFASRARTMIEQPETRQVPDMDKVGKSRG